MRWQSGSPPQRFIIDIFEGQGDTYPETPVLRDGVSCIVLGMHLMDEYVIEIVDPETGKQLGPGEIGEIVVTPIHNKVWGLVRFGTGDLSSYITEPCPCSRTANRLTGIVGRAGDAIKVRGMFVVAKQAEQVFLGFEEIAKFQISVTRREQRDEMTLKVELKHEATEEDKRRR